MITTTLLLRQKNGKEHGHRSWALVKNIGPCSSPPIVVPVAYSPSSYWSALNPTP